MYAPLCIDIYTRTVITFTYIVVYVCCCRFVEFLESCFPIGWVGGRYSLRIYLLRRMHCAEIHVSWLILATIARVLCLFARIPTGWGEELLGFGPLL